MSVMTAPDFWSGQDRMLTVEDMENMPDDEFRYERVPDVAAVRVGSLDTVFQETPPELVVEFASPRTRFYDRNRKKDVHQGFGISAYWIVEPDRDCPELTVFELRKGSYEQIAHVTDDEEYRAVLPFPATITPSQLLTLG